MRVAAVQTTATGDRAANLRSAAALVARAAAEGATLVVLPEHFSVAGDGPTLRRVAEPLGGPTLTWAAEVARRHGVWLVAGSLPELPPPAPGGGTDGRVHNTSCLLGPDGSLVAAYRKIHLFDVTVPGATHRESADLAPGTTPGLAPLGAGAGPAPVLGLALCYDLRFPELFGLLARSGATVVAVPAAFTAVTGADHWEVLVRARAIDGQVFVIAAGQVGPLPPGMPPCHGHSMIVDPWGTILAEHKEPVPGIVVADLDFPAQDRIRRELPVLENRRPEAYRWPGDDRGREARHSP